MSRERSCLAAAAVSGKIYAIGGLGNGDNLSSVEAFDPQTGTVWENRACAICLSGGPSRSRSRSRSPNSCCSSSVG